MNALDILQTIAERLSQSSHFFYYLPYQKDNLIKYSKIISRRQKLQQEISKRSAIKHSVSLLKSFRNRDANHDKRGASLLGNTEKPQHPLPPVSPPARIDVLKFQYSGAFLYLRSTLFLQQLMHTKKWKERLPY
jgi:hypothetical protein